MKKSRILNLMCAVLEIAAILAVLFITAGLIFRYVQYGEENGIRSGASHQESGEAVAAEMETADPARQKNDAGNADPEDLSEQSVQDAENTAANRTVQEKGEAVSEQQTPESNKYNPDIRVQISGGDYTSEYHDVIELTCNAAYTVSEYGSNPASGGSEEYETNQTAEASAEYNQNQTAETSAEYNPNQITASDQDESATKPAEISVKSAGEQFTIEKSGMKEGESICIEPEEGSSLEVLSLDRADGHPYYSGKLYIYCEAEGLALINELPLETYLCSVVSSEMPSDYPLEAQKAQAVCARTYAWNHLEQQGCMDGLANLDDSVMFQVYNNFGCTEKSSEAVAATAGQVLQSQEALYYSTSCLSEQRTNLTTDKAFADFLDEVPSEEEEYDSPWLRWEVTLNISDIIQNLVQQGEGAESAALDALRVTKRAGTGQAQELELICGEESFTIEGEYQIRCILGTGNAEIILMDGSTVSGMQLLPSAFFVLEELDSGNGTVRLKGGGYGHGIGMSQCGAAQMASEGLDYQEILSYYYEEKIVEISNADR